MDLAGSLSVDGQEAAGSPRLEHECTRTLNLPFSFPAKLQLNLNLK